MTETRPSHPARKAAEDEAAIRLADWLAWASQLLVGFLVGCGAGFKIARVGFRPSFNELLLIAAGAGLICGAFTSYLGNRVWMARSIFLAPEEPPPQKARAGSIVIGGFGVVIVLLTLIHHMASVFQNQRSHTPGFIVFLLILAAVPGFLAVRGLRTGTLLWEFGFINRDETPLAFWIYVILYLVACVGSIAMAS